MIDVAAIGELLIDFTPCGVSENGNPLFERNPGGAPANVLAMVSKLGGSTVLLGKVGDDSFGRFLAQNLEENRIGLTGLRMTKEVPTTLAFVHLSAEGDRSFSFYRNPGADMMLSTDEVDFSLIDGAHIFHAGSVSMTDEPCRSATFDALSHAKSAGKIVSFDPNLRPPLWKALSDAKEMILRGLGYADILKISEEELVFITGDADMASGTKVLAAKGIPLIFVTLGPKGTFFRAGSQTGLLRTYDTRVADTTGAGDAFLGAALYRLRSVTQEGLTHPTEIDLPDIVDFANAAGALATTRKGAIPSLPTLRQIEDCRRIVPRLEF